MAYVYDLFPSFNQKRENMLQIDGRLAGRCCGTKGKGKAGRQAARAVTHQSSGLLLLAIRRGTPKLLSTVCVAAPNCSSHFSVNLVQQ